ncbi:MAG TPA: TonB-dependent receptor [Methylotenera sp.]
MNLYQQKKSTQKSLYLAVILALQSMTAIAEGKVEKAAAQQELEEVNVKASAVQADDGYQATKTRVGKVLQDPHDVPQAVTTVTASLIKDQQLSSLKEALSNVAGLTFNAAEGGRAGDNMMLRGFYTFGDIYLDGVRDTAQYNRELFNLEQVDVLRGSAAMLFGRGQAGGVINQVSKMAKLTDENIVSGSLGSYNYHQFTGDFNKKLGDTTAIRVNVMDRAEENYRKNPTNGDRPRLDRQGIALSFGTGIGTDNEFFLNHVTTKTDDDPDFGVSFFNKRPVNRNVAGGKIDDSVYFGGSKNFDSSNTSITTAIFTHKFTEDTQLRTQLRDADYERAYWAQKPSASALPTADFSSTGAVTRKMHYQTQTLQSDFSTKFELAGLKHQFLTGVEYLKEKNYRNSLIDLASGSAKFYESGVENTANPVKFDADNYALYFQDTVTIAPKWDVLFGMRRDELRANYSSATSPKLSYGENSYRTALSYHYTPEAHYYVSYSDSFSPTADLYQLTVKPQPAERSKTIELGTKWLFLDGDLAFRTALYSTEKDWERNTDLESTAAILTKKRRTNGLEFELAGRITENWEVFSGLAFMDAEILEVAENVNASDGVITKAFSGYEGKRPRNTPSATFNIWSTYKFAEKWKFGMGLEAKGERLGYNPSGGAGSNFTNGKFDPNTLPGYARLDAMLSYEEKKWAVKFNVKNLLDKTYYDAIYDNGSFSVPGNSRTAILTTELKF